MSKSNKWQPLSRRRPILQNGVALVVCGLALACGPTSPEKKDLANANAAHAVRHPLDPLSADELQETLRILNEAGRTVYGSRFATLTLDEPEKDKVLAGAEAPRRAFAVIRQQGATYETTVDLAHGEVISWAEVAGVQPSIMREEIGIIRGLLADSELFQDRLQARGIESFWSVQCSPVSPGYFPGDPEHRTVHAICFSVDESRNVFSRPIEGLFATIDLDRRAIVEIVDTGVVELPSPNAAYDQLRLPTRRQELHLPTLTQEAGPSYRLAGHLVSWQNWSFHYRFDKRTGLVISMVRYQDGEHLRSVLYQGFLSEIFVPYMDPSDPWYWRTFMDGGEYGLGRFATPLERGVDCPRFATYLDATLSNDRGQPDVSNDTVCIFERSRGDAAWRHYEGYHGTHDTRLAAELVIRTAATLGNYDYVVDWILTLDGRIRVAIGSTGMLLPKAVVTRTLEDDSAIAETAYGSLVGANLVAPNHDHFFNFRLDVDVDGKNNSMEVVRLKTRMLDGHRRRSVWVAESRILASEQEAKLSYNVNTPAIWQVVNSAVKGPLGHHPGYALKPSGSAAYNLLSPEDPPFQRAGFTRYPLWVTPYSPAELFAAGRYVYQSRGGAGLPRWTAHDRNLVDTDIVLWYTMGYHHVPRTEDWPIMPTSWSFFELVPRNFFAMNPALDLPSHADSTSTDVLP